MKKLGALCTPYRASAVTNTSIVTPPSNEVVSLDGTSVIFPVSDGIILEGNAIIHYGSDLEHRNCFIGGVLTSVCNLLFPSNLPSSFIPSFSLTLSLSDIGNPSDVCITLLLYSFLPSLSAHSSFVIRVLTVSISLHPLYHIHCRLFPYAGITQFFTWISPR